MSIDLAQLREAPFLNLFLKDSALARFIKDGVWEKHPSGKTIYKQGDPATEIYLLAVGSVRLYSKGRELTSIAPNEIFGEASPLLGRERTVDAVAASLSVTFKFDIVVLEQVAIETRYALLRYIFATTAERLAAVSRALDGQDAKNP